MSVSRTVSEIFSIKEWRDVETGGRGRSRSLEMTLSNTPYTAFYWYHFCATWRKKYRDLEIWVRDHWRSFKLVPFKRLGAVSYSPSIITMAVSLTDYEIFSIKECVTLKAGLGVVQGHWKMVPFDRPYTTFYWSAIVSIALTGTVWVIWRWIILWPWNLG